MKTIATLLLAFPVIIAKAQITFDKGDFPSPGITIEYFEGWNDSIQMGNADTAQLYDFSSILSNIQDTMTTEYLDPANTPFGGQHSGSTVVYKEALEKDSATGQTVVEFWQYLTITSANGKYTGITVNVDTAYLFSQQTPSSLQAFHADYAPVAEFIGTSWTFNSIFQTNTSWRVAIADFSHTEDIYRDIIIDSWGSFKNPWNEFDAIRFKVFETRTGHDTTNGIETDYFVDTMYYFEYWTKGLGNYIARAYTNDDYTQLQYFQVAHQENPVGISQDEIFTDDVLLFPNPVRNVLYIHTSQKGSLKYKIYNTNGALVLYGDLRNDSTMGHGINVSNLDKGLYLFELRSGNKIVGRNQVMVE